MSHPRDRGFIIVPILFLITCMGIGATLLSTLIHKQVKESGSYIRYRTLLNTHVATLTSESTKLFCTENFDQIPAYPEPLTPTTLLQNNVRFLNLPSPTISLKLVKTPRFVYSVAISKNGETTTIFRQGYLVSNQEIQWKEIEPW